MGKLLGPQGSTIKRLQEETGAKISVLGKGSMRDKNKVIDGLSLGASLKNRSPAFIFLPFMYFMFFRRRSYGKVEKPNMLTSPWNCMCLLRSQHLYLKLTCEWPTPWTRSRSSSFRYGSVLPSAV